MFRRSESAPAIGEAMEQMARNYLESRGLKTLQRNYRCRVGEIDLIMQDQSCLSFIEVRYRRSGGFGQAAETVDRRKQLRLIRAAQHYLQRHPTGLDCRFDVLAITGKQVQWLKNAFDAE